MMLLQINRQPSGFLNIINHLDGLSQGRRGRGLSALVAGAALLVSTATHGAEPGMFLCRSPVVANDFWTDLNQAAVAGVKLNMEIAIGIAQKNGCPFVPSPNLKPVDFVAEQMAITDGKIKGWAAPQLYIMYVNRPTN
jgi:hypothetical protein